MTSARELPIDTGMDGRISTSSFVEAAGLRWYVRRMGAGPSVVLIHGTGASSHSWDGIAALLGAEFSVTVADLPGHGQSQSIASPMMTLENIAMCLGELLNTLECTPEILVGHSAGAAIAIRMVLDGRVALPRQIISINGALLQWQGLARLVFPPLARLLASGGLVAHLLAARAGHAGAVERMLAGTGNPPPARSVAAYESLMRTPSHVKATLDMMARWDLETLERDLVRLAAPLELIACGGDLAIQPDIAFKVQEKVPMAGVTFLRTLGHLAHEEDPGVIADCIRSIWRKRTSGAMACPTVSGVTS